jgi:hypothetical protein
VNVLDGNSNAPPSLDEIEISIFGPGIGECIAIHLGDNEWMIVDSCLERESRQPIALKYLAELGIDAATSVRLFVITHWHDDHIKGAAHILSACRKAKFVCSEALRSDEFIQFVRICSTRSLMASSGADEFDRIFSELQLRSADKRPQSVGPDVWAIADRRLLCLPKNNRSFNVEVFALSPSDTAMTLALSEIGQLLPTAGMPKRRAVAQSPNHVSVALWIISGNLNILLGSDLESHPDKRLGWRAVVLSSNRPSGRAFTVKVPHHGSPNAYYHKMWSELATPEALALLTPYASGTRPLPSRDDIEKIRTHTSQIYCTGNPSGWKPPRRDSTVDKTLREIVRTRRVVHGPMGQVRVRLSPEQGVDSPAIELFGEARHLT